MIFGCRSFDFSFVPSTASYDRNPFGRGCDGSDRPSDAAVLFVREHCQPHVENGNHGSGGKNQRQRGNLQVSRLLSIIELRTETN